MTPSDMVPAGYMAKRVVAASIATQLSIRWRQWCFSCWLCFSERCRSAAGAQRDGTRREQGDRLRDCHALHDWSNRGRSGGRRRNLLPGTQRFADNRGMSRISFVLVFVIAALVPYPSLALRSATALALETSAPAAPSGTTSRNFVSSRATGLDPLRR